MRQLEATKKESEIEKKLGGITFDNPLRNPCWYFYGTGTYLKLEKCEYCSINKTNLCNVVSYGRNTFLDYLFNKRIKHNNSTNTNIQYVVKKEDYFDARLCMLTTGKVPTKLTYVVVNSTLSPKNIVQLLEDYKGRIIVREIKKTTDFFEYKNKPNFPKFKTYRELNETIKKDLLEFLK